MRAGQYGFYGSSMQPGNQYTLEITTNGPCSGKKFNPILGEGEYVMQRQHLVLHRREKINAEVPSGVILNYNKNL